MPYPLTPVRWFHSGMADAPVLRGEAGAMIELLDACLLNGFCTRTLDSLVVSGEVATATIGAGNPYDQHAVIRISGASIAELNGDHRIDTAGASSFTFPAPAVSDGAASGTITVIRSPAGWSKPFSGTNKAAYQGDESSTQLYLRVDDSESLYSNVRGYENLTDIDTGTGLFPTTVLAANYWWTKSNIAGAAARPWALFADGGMVWFTAGWYGTTPQLYALNHFGDGVPFSPADAYFCTIGGSLGTKSVSSAPGPGHPTTYLDSPAYPRFCARPTSGGAAARFRLLALSINNSMFSTGSNTDPVADTGGGVTIGPPILAGDGVSTVLRGAFPGPRPVLQRLPFADLQIQETGGGLFMPVRGFTSSGYEYQIVFDILGPWR